MSEVMDDDMDDDTDDAVDPTTHGIRRIELLLHLMDEEINSFTEMFDAYSLKHKDARRKFVKHVYKKLKKGPSDDMIHSLITEMGSPSIRSVITEMLYLLDANRNIVKTVQNIPSSDLIIPSSTTLYYYEETDDPKMKYKHSGHAIILYTGDGKMHMNDPNTIFNAEQSTFSYFYFEPDSYDCKQKVGKKYFDRVIKPVFNFLGGNKGTCWWLMLTLVLMVALIAAVVSIIIRINNQIMPLTPSSGN